MHTYDPEQAITEARREFGEHGGVAPSIERSSTFTVMEPGRMPEIFAGKRGPDRAGCYLYSRHFNPTVDVLDRYLAAMDGTGFAVSTASGMSAIVCTLLQICHHGGHIVASNMIYGGTHALLSETLPQMGVATTFAPPDDLAAIDCGTLDRANRLLAVLQNEEQFGLIAVSLGYYDTLMSCSGSSTSSEIDPDEQRRIGLSPGLLRVSVGFTGSLDSRLEQVERTLRKVGMV